MPYCHYAKSLGELEGTPFEAWGTPIYEYKKHKKESAVFFGLYDLRDYLALFRHRGLSYVLWAGSDIKNLQKEFALNDGKLKRISNIFGNKWVYPILKKAEHWVENKVEWEALHRLGIHSKICPSFMGDINKFKVTFRPKKIPDVYISASEGRQEEYGFGVVERIADLLPVRFHLYGARWETRRKNIMVHGRVPKEQMNEEISKMQIGLRLNDFDGFSEILAKCILQGQWPVSRIEYPGIPACRTDQELIDQIKGVAGVKGSFPERDWYVNNINKFPWVV